LEYKSTGSNFNNYLAFESKARIGFKVNSNSAWKTQLEVRQAEGPNYCIITFTNLGEIVPKCSNRFGLKWSRYSPQKLTVDFNQHRTWSYFDIVHERDEEGFDNMYLMSADTSQNEVLFLKDAKLSGSLHVKWLPANIDMSYNFNCYSSE